MNPAYLVTFVPYFIELQKQMAFLKKLLPELNEALNDLGFEAPINEQKACITQIKSGADMICVGPENSGKTTAMIIGLIQQLKKAVNDVPRALVVVADKDKMDELQTLFDKFARYTDLRIFHVIGGNKLEKIRDKIYHGSDIIIGTPGSLNEMYSYSGLNLNDLKILVLDGADDFLRRNGIPQVDRLSATISKVQRLVFCTTMMEGVERFADEYMVSDEVFELKPEVEALDEIEETDENTKIDNLENSEESQE